MKNRLLAVAFIAVILLIPTVSVIGSDQSIRTIYHSPEEWAERFQTPEYHENEEITGYYDHSLAAVCDNGTFVGLREGNGTVSWKGIPFAKIPARFERSVYPDPSDKVYQAYYYGKSCMQPVDDSGDEMASRYRQGDLDCLTLAVYSGKSNSTGRPVMVYIHGGGWINGGTSDYLYNGTNFVYYNPDILVVDITYRVGPLGQINLGVMDGGEYLFSDYQENEDKFKTSVNNGILDQIQALRWIKENISAFGGDPDNVTICGESAGGGSVAILTMIASDPNNGYIGNDEKLFTKVISMSGGFNQITNMKKTEDLTRAVIRDLDVHSIRELQELDFDTLSQWWNDPEVYTLVNFSSMDGNVIPADPYNVYSESVGDNIVMLQGATTNEFAYYRSVLGGIIDALGITFEDVCRALRDIAIGPSTIYPDFVPSQEFADAYNAYLTAFDGKTETEKVLEYANDYTLQGINYYMADRQARNGGTTFTYAFDQPYDGTYAYMKAGHAADCSYLFGNFDGTTSFGTKEEVDFSVMFQKMIAQFCRTGNPSVDGYEWKPYDPEHMNCMFLRAGETELIENYNSVRILNFVKMIDTNEHIKFVEKWNNVFRQALTYKETGS